VVAGVTLISLAVAVMWALHRPSDRVVGANGVHPFEFVVDVPTRATVCDELGLVRRPFDVVAITLGTYGQPAQPVRLSIDGHEGRILRTYAEGVVELPVPPIRRRGGRRACIQNLGSRTIALAGARSGVPRLVVSGRPRRAALAFEMRQRHPAPWSTRVDEIRRNIGTAVGAPLGRMTAWLVALLYSGAVAIALWMIVRWSR